MNQRLDVGLDAPGHLLDPLDLEGVLYFAEAAFDAIKLGTIAEIKDDFDAELF